MWIGRFNVLPSQAMSTAAYSEINLHITWHTKQSDPVITEAIESRLHHFLEHKILETKGVLLHALDGTQDHIHAVASVPPSLLVSEWIGRLKGGSSFYINHEIVNRKLLDWQSGYGVVSFGNKDLEWVVTYILNQKEHHQKGMTVNRLERITNDDGLKPALGKHAEAR